MTHWTADRTERLKKLWADGWTGGQIASELGTCRNAVIGKVHRLGLAKRAAPRPALLKPRQPKPGRLTVKGTGFVAKRFASQPPPIPLIEAPPMIPDESTRCSILDVGPTKCRWIVGDARNPLEAIYCGGKPSLRPWGKFGRGACPYCDAHADLATGKRAA